MEKYLIGENGYEDAEKRTGMDPKNATEKGRYDTLIKEEEKSCQRNTQMRSS